MAHGHISDYYYFVLYVPVRGSRLLLYSYLCKFILLTQLLPPQDFLCPFQHKVVPLSHGLYDTFLYNSIGTLPWRYDCLICHMYACALILKYLRSLIKRSVSWFFLHKNSIALLSEVNEEKLCSKAAGPNSNLLSYGYPIFCLNYIAQ